MTSHEKYSLSVRTSHFGFGDRPRAPLRRFFRHNAQLRLTATRHARFRSRRRLEYQFLVPHLDHLGVDAALIDKVVLIDRCAAVLRRAGLSADINVAAFTAAALASGDIGHGYDAERYPCELCFALVSVGDYGGGPPTAGAWRRVLASAAPLPPTPLPRLVRSDALPTGLVREVSSW
jgi:hypothetical protein